MKILLSLVLAAAMLQSAAAAQDVQKTVPERQAAASSPENELKAFYDSYAEDLRLGRREAIADRYDARGYYSVGNGAKTLVSFEDAKKRYMTRWTMPKAFDWKDLSFEILSPVTAAVVGQFDYQAGSGEKATFSYSAVLNKQAGRWRIRIEDESFNTLGYATKNITGNRDTPGPYKYTLTAQPATAISAHRHTADMKITVKSGRKFILMGDLDTAKVQKLETGSTFVIPANTWHVEWWEDETVEEIEMIAPTRTERATPGTPRTH